MYIREAPYYNDLQLSIKFSSKPFKMVVAGRGAGKTTIITEEELKNIQAMPRGKFALGGLTYFHIRTKSMPPIIDFLEQRGLFRDIHYYIGHKAPKKFGWKEPYQPPLDYSNCIHFYNGCVLEFISFDRPEMARSGSYDHMVFDEAAKLKKSALDSDVLPANRGNGQRFEHVRFHHGVTYLTTPPLSTDGEWIYDYEDYAKDEPQDYMFLETSARVNEKILGDRYFRDLKRVLPKIVYDIEIEALRPKFNENGFYPKLSADHLYYDSYNYQFIDSLGYDIVSKGSFDSRCDKDCDSTKPLDISWDFGSRINSCVVCQEGLGEYKLIKNFYRENDTYQKVAEDFVNYYGYHKDKSVFLYGGSDGMKKLANSTKSYLEDIRDILSKAGWKVYNLAKWSEIKHMDKYRFYNILLSDQHPNLPYFRINQNNANETYISMKNAPIEPHEIKKDKRSERDDNLAQWKATHLSDAVDNVVYWKLSQRLKGTAPTFDMQILK